MSEPSRTLTQRLFTHKWVFWIALLGSVVADLGSKAWADVSIRPEPEKTFKVIEGWLSWRWAENLGAAFSIFTGQVSVLLSIAGIVLAAVIFFAMKADRKRRWYLIALGLVAGGAIGNIYDRALLGYVRDFIYFDFDLPWYGARLGYFDIQMFGKDLSKLGYTIPRRWPIFNIADITIMGGVAVMLVMSFFAPDPKKILKKRPHGA